ncbi:carotenoid oxygenase family protein [Candidatus Dependentiae bacterium]|nr:carotenoid oxygenase family protein [Candidatus Dependentiae bacterium]
MFKLNPIQITFIALLFTGIGGVGSYYLKMPTSGTTQHLPTLHQSVIHNCTPEPHPETSQQPKGKKKRRTKPSRFHKKKTRPKTTVESTHAKSSSVHLAFTSLKEETNIPQKLRITGKVPAWLQGELLRTGPALFEHNKSQAYAFFDGCALLHRFSCDQGNITYQNHYLRSQYWDQVHEQEKFGMQTEAKGGLFSKLGSLLKDSEPTYDNGASDICCLDGNFCAITETPLYHTFDPKDFSQQGLLKFDDNLSAHYSCAHLHQDDKTGDLYGYAIQFGNTSTYIPYKIKAQSTRRIPLAKINVSYPAYMHSFAYTDKYLVFIEPPLRVNPIDLLLGNKSFLETYVWYPKQKTNILVLDKHTGNTIGKFNAPPLFYLHHINAYEQGGKLIIDVPIYEDQSIVSSFNLQPYREGKNPIIPKAKPTRFTIDLQNKQIDLHTLSEMSLEMPHINYEVAHGKPYTFVYGTHIPTHQTTMTHLIKLDVTNGNTLLWHEDGCYPGEPVFVAAPTGNTEDDGVLLSVVLDTRTGTSFLLILDAHTMQEYARAHLTHHVPLDSHGHFYKR